MRRILGPVGGPVAFLLVAGLVFTGLGWVTVAALRVEAAQREAAAEAAVANKLRVALWRLDGRLLPALGAENARTFLEYAPPDPTSPYGPTCAQLLAAPLPDWMKLHAQLDPEDGWSSPQVLTPDAATLFAEAWPELRPVNATPERARALDALQRRHQFKAAYAAIAARDAAPVPSDGGRRPVEGTPLRMPLPAGLGAVNAPAPPASGPDRPERGTEREQVAPPRPKDAPAAPAATPAPPPRPAEVVADATTRGLEPGDNRGEAQARRRAADLAELARQPSTYIYPLPNNYTQNFRNQNGADQLANGANSGRFVGPPAPTDRTNKLDEKVAGALGLNTQGKYLNDAARLDRASKADGSAAGARALAAPGPAPGDGPRGEPNADTAPARPSLAALGDFLARGIRPDAAGKDALRQSDLDPKSKGPAGAMAMTGPAKQERIFGYGAPLAGGGPVPGGVPSGGAGRGGIAGGFGGGTPMPPAAPGFAGPMPLPKGQVEPEGASRAKGAAPALAKAAPTSDPRAAAPAGPPALTAAPPAPMTLPVVPPPAAAGEPQPPTPDPAVPPVLQPAEPVAPADAPAPPLVLLNPPPVAVHLGPVRPQWLTAADGNDSLVLVRTARLDGRTVYQGVVLDWPRLQEVLRDDVKDLFPEAVLVPVKGGEGSPDRAMSALPVQLDPGPAAAPPPVGWSPLRIGLALAWVAALIAFGAIGLAGWSLIDLSERRIRFVSAVTHELRTPLTSLRLYLDLLLSGLVHDEAKRTEYLSTLATESDRLHRLVDNVLDFARLEHRRAGSTRTPTKVADLLAAVRDTWTDRCGTDGKELIVVSTLPPEAEVTTDAALVGQVVGNLIDNARKYTRSASDPRVWVWAKPEGRRVVLEVEDRGPGVPPRERALIFRPFRRGEGADTTAGGAGLGLALCKQWAESLGGTLTYRPADGDTGACFRLELPGK